MAAIKRPYFAPPSELPQPLPTTQEIHAATEQYMQSGGRRLVRIGPYMIKHGDGVNVLEGENMLFVSRKTTVPVPRVYAIYTATEISVYTAKQIEVSYIVMERIEGNTLDFEWNSLSTSQKDRISALLRAHMSHLRALPKILQGHPPVFTHGDLQRKNILLRRRIPPATTAAASGVISPPPSSGAEEAAPEPELELQDDDDDDFELVIIDWENSGWYPEYWESAIALFACGRWSDDWHVWLGKALDLFLNEYVWMQMIRTELWS